MKACDRELEFTDQQEPIEFVVTGGIVMNWRVRDL